MLADGLNRFLTLRESWAFGFLAVVAALTVGFLALRWIFILFRSGSDVGVALAVEKSHPEFMDALVCAAELERVPPEKLRPIEKALLAQVGRKTRSFDFSGAVFPAHLRWRKLAVPAVLFVLIAGFALNTEPVAKAVFHFRDLRSGTHSGLAVTPGDVETPEHTDIRVEAEVRRWRNEAYIVYETPEEGRQRFVMNKGGGGRHFFTF